MCPILLYLFIDPLIPPRPPHCPSIDRFRLHILYTPSARYLSVSAAFYAHLRTGWLRLFTLLLRCCLLLTFAELVYVVFVCSCVWWCYHTRILHLYTSGRIGRFIPAFVILLHTVPFVVPIFDFPLVLRYRFYNFSFIVEFHLFVSTLPVRCDLIVRFVRLRRLPLYVLRSSPTFALRVVTPRSIHHILYSIPLPRFYVCVVTLLLICLLLLGGTSHLLMVVGSACWWPYKSTFVFDPPHIWPPHILYCPRHCCPLPTFVAPPLFPHFSIVPPSPSLVVVEVEWEEMEWEGWSDAGLVAPLFPFVYSLMSHFSGIPSHIPHIAIVLSPHLYFVIVIVHLILELNRLRPLSLTTLFYLFPTPSFIYERSDGCRSFVG